MSKQKSLNIYLIGLAIVGIYIRIRTGISTASAGSESGLVGFMVSRTSDILIGKKYSIDLFFNPVGYLMMAIGVKQLGDSIRKSKELFVGLMLGILVSLTTAFLPLFISSGVLLVKLIIGMYILEGIVLLYVMVTFNNEVKSKVDSYYNMEVSKDLTFATELFFIAYFVIIIVIFAKAIGIYFATALMYFDYAIMVYSIIYMVYKLNKYNKTLKFFDKTEV